MKHTSILFFTLTCTAAHATDWIMLPQMQNPFMSLYNETSGPAVIELYNKVDEVAKKYEAARNKEQSTENKLLGAAGIGATGIGAMNLMSAAAEQSADEKAEAAMKAYLATFHCNYGAGKNIPGGETEVQLPGGNELVSLYAEYVNLANDLKVRKAALDMRPGIESESILDSATSGLYDDIAIGKTSGAFTSLARALSDPNSADAAAWAQQKADTASKLKTGAITAGIGAAGSLVGNLVINHENGEEDKKESQDKQSKPESTTDTSAKKSNTTDTVSNKAPDDTKVVRNKISTEKK